jgi:hypothetical protein
MSEKEVYKPQGKGDKTSDWGQWGPKKKKGRPHKVDEHGQKIYRLPTSIYLDLRLKEWITDKVDNLSDWIETMIRKAYQKEYCFYCFDDDVKEVMHGWVCCNDKHRRKAGNGAPSVVLEWKRCPTCDAWFNERNFPVEIEIDGDLYCDMCKKEQILLEVK